MPKHRFIQQQKYARLSKIGYYLASVINVRYSFYLRLDRVQMLEGFNGEGNTWLSTLWGVFIQTLGQLHL
jgi:uncharacterized membrane protein YiaA